MTRVLALLAIAGLFAGPAFTSTAGDCPRQAMPPALESAGFRADAWPTGEVIRFSATPSFERTAYAVQITRPGPGRAPGEVHLIKLERQTGCNRYDRVGEWHFPLSAYGTTRFFEQIGELESNWREADEIVMDGTAFDFHHKRDGRVVSLDPSASAQGQSGRLSALILSLVRPIARGSLPDAVNWTER